MKLGINLNAWKGKTEKAKEKIRSSATEYVRSTAKKIYLEALKVSPQYSGNYVANWAIELTINPVSHSRQHKVEPWQRMWTTKKHMGHMAAINSAMQTEADTFELIKWNSNIMLRNMAPVHAKLETKLPPPLGVRLRPENIISGNKTVIEHLKSKYKFLSKT